MELRCVFFFPRFRDDICIARFLLPYVCCIRLANLCSDFKEVVPSIGKKAHEKDKQQHSQSDEA